jgi:hypothetical protein
MRNSLYNVDGVEETGRCNGGLVVEGCKHIIFPTLIFFKKHGGVYVYICKKKIMKYAILIDGEEQPLKFHAESINELFEFLLDYDIDFDTVKLITDIGNLNNFSLN